jgi:8-hydroxy-5-deazaflavin:NADPH oxidoreductase
MKIGIIGSGEVGRRLADGLLALGHQVKLGTRDKSKKEVVEWIEEHRKKGGKEAENALIGSFAEAASFGDELVILSTSWSGTANAIQMADPTNMIGKVVIDTESLRFFTRHSSTYGSWKHRFSSRNNSALTPSEQNSQSI